MISGSAWSSDLYGRLSGIGFLGSRLHDFTDAIGNGSQLHVVGKAFATSDVGTIAGAGVGSGTGISGVDPSLVSSTIYATAIGLFGQFGSRLQDLCDALGQNVVAQMLTAQLDSTHTPVFAGVGTIVVNSITVVGPAWASSIEGAAPGFIGNKWPDLAQAIGQGFFTGVFSGGTGTVTITGSPSGIPSPGAGSGVGTIS
jgi:hypothetical protein